MATLYNIVSLLPDNNPYPSEYLYLYLRIKEKYNALLRYHVNEFLFINRLKSRFDSGENVSNDIINVLLHELAILEDMQKEAYILPNNGGQLSVVIYVVINQIKSEVEKHKNILDPVSSLISRTSNLNIAEGKRKNMEFNSSSSGPSFLQHEKAFPTVVGLNSLLKKKMLDQMLYFKTYKSSYTETYKKKYIDTYNDIYTDYTELADFFNDSKKEAEEILSKDEPLDSDDLYYLANLLVEEHRLLKTFHNYYLNPTIVDHFINQIIDNEIRTMVYRIADEIIFMHDTFINRAKYIIEQQHALKH